jgi:hypothetical protein
MLTLDIVFIWYEFIVEGINYLILNCKLVFTDLRQLLLTDICALSYNIYIIDFKKNVCIFNHRTELRIHRFYDRATMEYWRENSLPYFSIKIILRSTGQQHWVHRWPARIWDSLSGNWLLSQLLIKLNGNRDGSHVTMKKFRMKWHFCVSRSIRRRKLPRLRFGLKSKLHQTIWFQEEARKKAQGMLTAKNRRKSIIPAPDRLDHSRGGAPMKSIYFTSPEWFL